MDVALIGLGESHDLAPWDHSGWELWGLPWDEGYWRYYNRLFEMHDIRLLDSELSQRVPGYIDRLREVEVPLYMQEAYFPTATKYPFVEGKVYQSSLAYMLALAIEEGYQNIALFGFDLVDEKYDYQIHNVEYWLGYADGKGINVILPDNQQFHKFNPNGITFYEFDVTYKDRYGWLG